MSAPYRSKKRADKTKVQMNYCSVTEDKNLDEQNRIAAFCNLMNEPHYNNTQQIPLYQISPRIKSTFHKCKISPTHSLESYRNRAERIYKILAQNHKYAPNTHWATLKFKKKETLQKIKTFLKSLKRKVQRWNKSHPTQQLAGYYHFEILESGLVHAHVILRGHNIFQSLVSKAAKETKCSASADDFLTTIDCFGRQARYSVGACQKDILLLRPGQGLRLDGSFGKYFIKSRRILLSEFHADLKKEPPAKPEEESTKIAIKSDPIALKFDYILVPFIRGPQTTRARPTARNKGHPTRKAFMGQIHMITSKGKYDNS